MAFTKIITEEAQQSLADVATAIAPSLATVPLNDVLLDTNPTVPGHIKGRVYYDTVNDCMAVDMNTDITLQVGEEELRLCYNATGKKILNGEVVYTNGVYNGGTNDVATVALAKADNATAAQALGCATQDINDSDYGFICVRGHVNGMDTNEIGRSYLQTQDMFFSARVGGTAGNSYSLTVIQTGGVLSYTELTPGVIVLDLGAGSPTTTDIETYMMTTMPSANIKVKATAVSTPTTHLIETFAHGVNTTVGDVLYLSAADNGFLTTIPPVAPNVRIRMGRLITKDATDGRINVRLLNYGRIQDLSDVTIASAVNGDIIVWDATTSSWKNVPNNLPTYQLYNDLHGVSGVQDNVVFCVETSTFYRYTTTGFTTDGYYVTTTNDGGSTRWVGIAGLYCWEQKGNTFIADKLIIGLEAATTTMSADIVLDDTVGGFLILNVTGTDHNLTLPNTAHSKKGQDLSILVLDTSAHNAMLKTTNTNLGHDYIFTPGLWATFSFGVNEWHLSGGKNAITQLDQLGNPTYKTTQDLVNVIESSGMLTDAEVMHDDSLGGITIDAFPAMCKTFDSNTAETAFFDKAAGAIPSASLVDQESNYIYVDYNGGLPAFGTTIDRATIRQTDQFCIGYLFKNGLDLEILSYESITNLARRDIERLIEERGATRVKGAEISESDAPNRYIKSSDGLFYYGAKRVPTTGVDSFTGYNFDIYHRDGLGGWIIESAQQIDNLNWDANDALGLHTLTPLNYGVMWVFICTQGDIYVLYGQGDYNLADAKTATMPNPLPPYMLCNTVLAAKIIVNQNGAFEGIYSAYTSTIGVTQVTDHNSLNGLQGGSALERYHLTSAEHTAVAGAGSIASGTFGGVGIYSSSPTGKTIADNIPFGSYNTRLNIADHTGITHNRDIVFPYVGATNLATLNVLFDQGNQTVHGIKEFVDGVKTQKIFNSANSVNYITFYKTDQTTPIANIDSINNVFTLVGTGASTITNLANTKLNGYDTVNDYIQNNIQNLSSGANATTDWIATADNGNDTTNYIDLGINGSGFTGGTFFPGGWHINGANDGYLYTSDGSLAIGTTNNSVLKDIIFFTGNPLLPNIKGFIKGDGHWSNGAHTPSSWMHLRAGVSAANGSPLKFSTGVNLSAVEDGAMEYNGSNLEFTVGSNRYYVGLGTNTSLLGTAAYTASSAYQPSNLNLTSLAGLSYGSPAFIKMTGVNTFTFDTNTYLTSVTAHNLLSATHGDTLTDTVVRGDIMYGNSTPKWARLPFPASPAGKILQATATDVAWSTNPLTIGASASVSGSNTGDQTLSSLGAQAQLNGTGFVKASGTTISYDNSTYLTSLSGALLATGATTGATSQKQVFTKGISAAGVGGATVGSGPLAITSTPLLTTPEAGNKEYNGDHYYTMANNTRVANMGLLYTDVADHSNSGGGGAGTETTLATYTMPANTLDNNNEYIEVGATISVVGGGNSIIKLYFGATAIYTVASGNYTGQSIQFRAKIFRSGATTQRATVSATASGGAITSANTYSTPAETLSSSVVIRVTGQNGTASNIAQRTFDVRHCGAPA